MSDPVAEAAAQLAALSVANMAETGAPTPFMEKFAAQQEAGTAPGNESAVAEASVTAPATAEEAGAAAVGEFIVGAMPATVEAPLVDSGTPQSTELSTASGDLPNVASGAAEPTTEPDSAPSADGANTTSPTDASSVEPLHVRVAAHLEAIFQMVKTDTQRAPTAAESHAEHVKTHIGDVLHRIRNGMAVAEGEMVQKLEALYRML